MKRGLIDFHEIEPGHLAIHARLENWAAWARNRYAPACAPGFELYQSSNSRRVYGAPTAPVVNRQDGAKIASAVAGLPPPHAAALSWCYVTKEGPAKVRRRLATTMTGLYQLVRDGRQMLINRGV